MKVAEERMYEMFKEIFGDKRMDAIDVATSLMVKIHEVSYVLLTTDKEWEAWKVDLMTNPDRMLMSCTIHFLDKLGFINYNMENETIKLNHDSKFVEFMIRENFADELFDPEENEDARTMIRLVSMIDDL